jgi:hypothetical protein
VRRSSRIACAVYANDLEAIVAAADRRRETMRFPAHIHEPLGF